MSDLEERIAKLSPEKRALLTLRLQKQRAAEAVLPRIPCRPNLSDPAPLSFSQQRLWFLSQMEPNNPFYTVPAAVRLIGTLDVPALELSLREILRRHTILHTRIAVKDGEPRQLVSSDWTFDLPILDLYDVPADEREVEAMRIARESACQPFDFCAGVLIRPLLIRLDDKDHILILTMHHIVSDGWSLGVLVRELAACYPAFLAGSEPNLPELPIQYADFAVWQRGWLQGKVLEDQLKDWKQQLEGAATVLELPSHNPRPAVQSFHGARERFEFPASLDAPLQALARQEGATLFMALLAGFELLISRYSGQTDFCLGTPIANRTHPETEELVGFFVNTLVIRARLDGSPTYRDLLRRVRATTLRAYAHQDLPFEMLVETLQPARDLSHSPLFQIMFAMQNEPIPPLNLPNLQVEPLEIDPGTSRFDLTLSIYEQSGHLAGFIEYSTDLFDQVTIQDFLAHYQHLLEEAIAHPDDPVSQLDLLTPAEKQQIRKWNATQVDLPAVLIHQVFEDQVRQHPQSPALIFGDQTLCYAELNQKANQLAHWLVNRGVVPETLVAIHLERSFERVVAILGVFKAGGAYLPIDPIYPRERIAFMLQDSGAQILLTQSSLLEGMADIPGTVFCFDRDWAEAARESGELIPCPANLDNLAYVIYTSGTTGKPKGVLIQHRGVVNLVLPQLEVLQAKPGSRMLQFASFSFDASVWEIFTMLSSGGTLVLAPQEVLASPPDLLALLADQNVNLALLPPSLLAVLPVIPLPQLITLIAGGEACPAEVVRRWGIGRRFINGYGPTEITVCASLMVCDPEEPGAPPIGRPISNTTLYVLDAHRQPVPVGIPGELWIGGLGVARGYLGRPELTQQKFLPNPFYGEPGARMYASGDLVRTRRDGCIEYLGRIDQQVKIRGYRIELGEIESQLEKHPRLRQATVLAREDVPGDKRMIAYLVPEESCNPPTSAELRSFLKQTLPDYMLPNGYVFLDSLPLTPSGKIDRAQLPAPAQANPLDEESVNSSPRTPTEEILSGIWARILGIQCAVGAFSNFFELGGHSLLASQVITRVRDAFQIDLPIRSLFEAPILADFAALIDIALCDESLRTDTTLIQPADRQSELPLSFAQQRLWFLNHLEPDNPSYNLFSALRITGDLDIPIFQASLERIVQRHEVLRTSFQTIDGKAVQVISEEACLPFEVVDLSDLPDQERQEAIDRRIKTEPFIPFDLSRAPLMRVSLLRIGPYEQIALFVMHHIISDGWSNNVLIQDLKSFYAQLVSGQEYNPPDLPVQYVDYAVWQREWLQGSRLEKITHYWEQQLADSPPLLELPTTRPRPPVQTSAGANLKFTFPDPLAEMLRSFARTEGITLFMALLAGFETLLYRYSAQEDFCIGTPVANRNRSEVEGLVGLFVNSLALRADLKGQPTFRELVSRVRETCLGAYAHQEMPFEKLLDALQTERSLSYNPLFQVMFVLQNNARVDLDLPGVSLEWMNFDPGIAMFDLSLAVEETPSGLKGNFEYNTDLFDASFIEGMVGHYQKLLEHALSDPETAISRLPLLSHDEERTILGEWNQTRWETPLLDLTVHQLFEAQAACAPEAPAMYSIAESSLLSFWELNQRANQLARRLRRSGIGPESIVGLCLDRTIAMGVALLGILKSGAAFLPLDWNYPPDRLAFMLSETSAALIVTRAKFKNHFEEAACPVLCLDSDWESIVEEDDTNLDALAGPENLAYVQYTSGSTGVPKGVLVDQRSLVNHNLSAAYLFSLTPADRVLQFATLNFDTALEEIFPAWISGASIVLRPAGELPATTDLLDWIDRYGITVLDLPTAYWHEWVAELETIHRPPACLRLVVVGGEKAYPEKLAAWEQSLGNDPKWMNTYGPTEGTIIASYYAPDSDRTRRPSYSLPIGRPLPNVSLYVLDPLLQPVPVGVTGELFIGGVGVARGYLNRPELNVEKFLADPFNPGSDGRMFRTGDLARWLPDGNVEYVGRQDDQVKIRGFRVEPGEIVTALLQYPNIVQAAVLAYEDAPGLRRLAAYIVLPEGTNPIPAELREFLKARLPDYMIPAAFHFLPALPLTSSGKLDRKALPTAVTTRLVLDAPLAAATSPVEAALVSVWKQVLGLDQVGIHDNFFELGGDSILSIQVVARARQVGLHLSPRLLFECPTIAALAQAISVTPLVQAEQRPVAGLVSLNPVQRWFFDQHLVNPQHWNQSVLLKVDHQLDPQTLYLAAQALLNHHDNLRTNFNQTPEGTWEARVPAHIDPLPIVFDDFSALDPETRRQALGFALQRCQASFQLSTGPLFQIAYFWLGNEQGGRLFLCAHHLVIDTVSWRILLEDLFTFLVQISTGQPLLLPAKTTSFQHWSSRLPGFVNEAAILDSLPFWLQLADLPTSPLPLDLPGGTNVEADGATISVSLGVEDTRKLLVEAPASLHAEPRLLLLTALAKALQSWTGPGCFQIEMEGHGREDLAADIDVSRTVGWFTSLFPMPLDLRSCPSPDQILRSIKQYFHTLPFQGLSYGILLNYHTDPMVRDRLSQLYQPQISFNYLGQVDTTFDNPTFSLAPEDPGPERSPAAQRGYPLVVTAAVVSGSLRIDCSFSRGQFLPVTISHLIDDLQQALLDLLHNPTPAASLTPEDFQDIDLSQEELESIIREISGPV